MGRRGLAQEDGGAACANSSNVVGRTPSVSWVLRLTVDSAPLRRSRKSSSVASANAGGMPAESSVRRFSSGATLT
jgi:hypothetical protein